MSAQDTSKQPRLFAAYIEVARTTHTGDRQRKQWVVLPPLPADLAPEGVQATSYLWYFYREQKHQRNRVAWRWSTDGDGTLPRWLSERVVLDVARGYELAPVVTCEISAYELSELMKNRKTPYRILERLSKVAKAKHGFAI